MSDLNKVLTDLDRRLNQLRNNEQLTGEERGAALVRLEEEVRRLLADSLGGEVHNLGSAALEDLQEWREVCDKLELTRASETGAALAKSYLEEAAGNWKNSQTELLLCPTAEGCFQALGQATVLQLTARSVYHGEAVAKATYDEVRGELRKAFEKQVQGYPPTARQRQQWVTELCDRADTVLTSIDGLPPERAAARLTLVREDIRWHLHHISRHWGVDRRPLKRKLNQIRAEEQERQLQGALEQKFGPRFVAASEQVILLLIFLVIGLMTVEFIWKASLAEQTLHWFALVDAGACVVFLVEFFTKLYYVKGKLHWFGRHFLIDFVPSIPFSLLYFGLAGVHPTDVDALRAGRLGRILQLTRLGRYARYLQPLIRTLRGVGLLARGLDRLARQFGHILNQNVILYPNRQELDQARRDAATSSTRLWALQQDLTSAWTQLMAGSSADVRETLALQRMQLLECCLSEVLHRHGGTGKFQQTLSREIPAETLITRLITVTPIGVEATLGGPLTRQLARMVRLFSRPPLRWLPIISSFTPDITEDSTPGEIVSLAARKAAGVIQQLHNVWFWVSDLYGTVTPSQFIDRVGGMLVKSASRPASRLLMFGGFLLLIELVLSFTTVNFLQPVRDFLQKFLAPTVMVVGTVSCIIMVIGWWLQRVAREATDFYERSVQAQFLALTEIIRTRNLRRDMGVIYDRVLKPEYDIRQAGSESTREERIGYLIQQARDTFIGQGEEVESLRGLGNILLLYYDWLDGAMFTDVDTRTTSQLIGNPSIRQLCTLSERITRKEYNALQRLDLTRQKSMFGGPFVWFNLICRSVAHSVAQQIVEYNQRAIPLEELPLSELELVAQYQRWLRSEQAGHPEIHPGRKRPIEADYLTTSFTALHFLDIDARRDTEIQRRFGDEVFRKLQRDRSLLIRRIFGTFPLHNRPKEDRVVNLYTLYVNWLSGGRALFLPWFLLLALLRLLRGLLKWLLRSLQELRKPERRDDSQDAATAPFLTAVRKIERIRGPVVYAGLQLRMVADPEYLGIPLPGQQRSPLERHSVDVDLEFLHPDPRLLHLVEQRRYRAEADIRRLEELLERGLLARLAERYNLPVESFHTPEHLRALTVAYVADFKHVRTYLSAAEILQEVYRLAAVDPIRPRHYWPRPFLENKFQKYWQEFGFGGEREKTAAWRATRHDVWGCQPALEVWSDKGESARAEGEARLAELLLHPSRITEQLMTLRTVQTLAVLDVLNYREHVYKLGQYAEAGETPGELLQWNSLDPVSGG